MGGHGLHLSGSEWRQLRALVNAYVNVEVPSYVGNFVTS
jgi:hypothetical protein